MSNNELFEYYQDTRDKNVVLSFKGVMSQDILVELKELMVSHLSRGAVQEQYHKNVFSVFIELSQNILHHSAAKVRMKNGDDVGAGIVVICENNKVFEISSGNMIDKSRLPEMMSLCDHLQNLDRAQLKRLYRERRKKPLSNGHKSSQLGMVEIAIKSGNPAMLKAMDINDQYAFLVISAIIKTGKENG